MDFTDLNKACPKDSYHLPRIDQLVDSTVGHQLLIFMDAFSGYNQIKMDQEDQEKTTFIPSQSLFCYKVMSFGLKNAGDNLSEVSQSYVPSTNRTECRSLRGRYAGEELG